MKIIIFIFSIYLVGCNYNVTKESDASDQGQNIKSISVLDYQTVRKTVIGPQCLNCHSNSGGNKGSLNLETYEAIKSNLNQIYYRSIEVGDMPEDGMDANLREILKVWIENGAPVQATEGSGPVQGPLSWSLVRNKIIAFKCLECHSGAKPEGNLNLDNYETFKSKLNIIFDRVFVKQDMPVAPYPALTISEKSALLKWISQGMPK